MDNSKFVNKGVMGSEPSYCIYIIACLPIIIGIVINYVLAIQFGRIWL